MPQAPAAQAQDAGPAGGAYQISLLLSLTTSQARRLSWTEAGTVYVVIDGKQVGESDLGFLDLPADQAVRGVLLAYKTLPDPLPTPRDQVLLTVTGPSGAGATPAPSTTSSGGRPVAPGRRSRPSWATPTSTDLCRTALTTTRPSTRTTRPANPTPARRGR